MPGRPDAASVHAVAALADPVRRGLFDAVRSAAAPLSREEAATAVGISRKLAAFHLDKLVDVGLLVAVTAEPHRQTRVGRRPKRYRPAESAVEVSIPTRRPGLLAELLLTAVTQRLPGEEPVAAALRISRERGREIGNNARSTRALGRLGAERALTLLSELLERWGFEPVRHEPGTISFRACPFQPLAKQAPAVVCGMHHAYMSGVLDGVAAKSLEAALIPGAGACCVELRVAIRD